MRVRSCIAALLVAIVPSALADVKLPSVFGSHMVLQRDMPVPVWGTAEPGEAVTVTIAGQTARTKANPKGDWQVRLKPLKLGDPLRMTVAGKNTVTFTDILVGDVWVCSGQSNMQWSLQATNKSAEEIAAAKFPNIRLFSVKRVVAQLPQTDCEGSWSACTPETVPGFSAVGYFFGRALHQKLKVPIGLIHTSWGGTPAESWTNRPHLEAHVETLPILARWLRVVEAYPVLKEKYEKEALPKWQEAVKKAKAEGKNPPRRPRGPGSSNSSHYPSGLYNAMIAPLVPYAIKGAIWYQGESNAGRAYQYRVLFPAMIRSWREVWKQGDFPFLFVQLANFLAVDAEPKADPWPELREAQSMTLALPNTGQAVIIDIGEARDIHPRNKKDVGERLAISGLKVAYGQDIVHSGPVFKAMKVEGNKAVISFTSVGGGLITKPFADPVLPHGPTLKKRFNLDAVPESKSQVRGFAIAGEDKVFVWADAKIVGDTVVVSSPKVPKPVAVRYGWANNPICNLYNKEGLPASPFRTDQWPGVTIKNR